MVASTMMFDSRMHSELGGGGNERGLICWKGCERLDLQEGHVSDGDNACNMIGPGGDAIWRMNVYTMGD
jgi:hypothetical protein